MADRRASGGTTSEGTLRRSTPRDRLRRTPARLCAAPSLDAIAPPPSARHAVSDSVAFAHPARSRSARQVEGDRYPPPHAGGMPPGYPTPYEYLQPHHAHHMGMVPPSYASPAFLPPPSQHSQFAPGFYQNSHVPSGPAADAAMRGAGGDQWRRPAVFGARQVTTETIVQMHLAGCMNREVSGACAARMRFVRAR